MVSYDGYQLNYCISARETRHTYDLMKDGREGRARVDCFIYILNIFIGV